MSYIFDRLKQHTQSFQSILNNNLLPAQEQHDYPWLNAVHEGNNIRRAHLDVVDRTDDRKLYMMHLCIFPVVNSKAPIYGFDLIAGPNKVTGAFHDFSPTHHGHDLDNYFTNITKKYSWNRTRELPEWAKQIFSPNIITASNIKEHDELERVLKLSTKSLSHYINTMKDDNSINVSNNSTSFQNKYCHFQKQNPHTPRVMESLGIDSETVRDFIDTCLFPEIEYL